MDPLLFEQLGRALRNDDAETRFKAIQELSKTQDAGAVRMAISHARTETKLAILQAIGKMAQQVDGKWDSLIKSQLDVSDNDEKCRILYIMSFLNDKKLHMMAADLFGHKDTSVRKAALKVLGKLGKDEKLHLFRKLITDKEVDTRLRAIKSVLSFKHKDVIPVLKTGIRDKEYDVRIASYEAIVTLKNAGIEEASVFLEKTQKPVPPPVSAAKPETAASNGTGGNDDDKNSKGENGSARMNAVDRLLGEGKTCKTCVHAKRERTDKQKMAPLRLWCINLKKEILPKHTCIRGKWNK